MANNIENTLSITGSKEHLTTCKDQLGKDFTIAVDTNTTLTYTNPIFALGNIISPEEGTYADRDWKEENWGTYSEVTKSDQGNIDSLVLEFPSIIEEKIDLIRYLFHSKNGEPLDSTLNLSKQYPNLTFNLESIDLDNGQSGVEYTIQNGSIDKERIIIFMDYETGTITYAS